MFRNRKLKKLLLERWCKLAKLPTAEEISQSIKEEAREGVKNEMIVQMRRFTNSGVDYNKERG